MRRYKDNSISFEESDLERFSRESGDRNPLHMSEEYAMSTLYRERVVFGMLGAIVLLKEYSVLATTINIKFNAPLFLNRRYSFHKEERNNVIFLYLKEEENKLITIKCKERETPRSVILEEKEWMHYPMLFDANNMSDEEISNGIAGEGEYDIAEGQMLNDNIMYRVLGLCSYVVGMISPGQRALFMQASVAIEENFFKIKRIRYRVKTVKYNPTLRVLENEIEVYNEEKTVAMCRVQVYVRVRFEQLTQKKYLINSSIYENETVLIIGGTKGLGAEIAKEYALNGARVVIVYHQHEEDANALKEQLSMFGNKVDFFKGDMSDFNSCDELHRHLKEKYLSIDRVYLCAAIPTRNLSLSLNTQAMLEEYVKNCLRIFCLPFLQTKSLIAGNGKIIFISSIAVVQKKEFCHLTDYIGAKALIESVFECCFYERKDTASYYVVRPPKMLTEMNNTPTGRMGAVSPELEAQRIVSEIEKENTQREYRVLESM